MKGFVFSIVAAMTGMALSGCPYRPIPVAASYPLTAQAKMQAAHHWDVLAEHIATRLKQSIDSIFLKAVTPPPIVIRFSREQEQVPFGKAFYHLLTSQLVRKGLVVMTNSGTRTASSTGYSDALSYANSLVIDYDMQTIEHRDRRLTYPPPGTFSALAGGVWLVARATDSWRNPELALFPVAAAADIAAGVNYYLPGETNREVIISTNVTMGQQVIFSSSDIYYINDGDDDHYASQSAKTYSVIGCAQAGVPCP
jgi:hypothetical protein